MLQLKKLSPEKLKMCSNDVILNVWPSPAGPIRVVTAGSKFRGVPGVILSILTGARPTRELVPMTQHGLVTCLRPLVSMQRMYAR